MELKLAPFDPFDHASPDGTTAVWLAAFEALEEPGPHGFLDFAKAGVLNFDESWFEVLKNTFDNSNPDLSSDSMEEINKEDLISKTIFAEEVKFFETLEKGILILEESIQGLKNKTIPGEVIFKLHDTFGFPFDLTADIAREKDLLVDQKGFLTEVIQSRAFAWVNNAFAQV